MEETFKLHHAALYSKCWYKRSGDTKKERYDYKTINSERIAKLPKDIQELIKNRFQLTYFT